jgi:hypothetical protein
MQPSSADQCSTPVSARSYKHNYFFASWVHIQEAYSGEVCQVAPSVFHHLDQLDAVVLHHRPVHFDHLLGGQER